MGGRWQYRKWRLIASWTLLDIATITRWVRFARATYAHMHGRLNALSAVHFWAALGAMAASSSRSSEGSCLAGFAGWVARFAGRLKEAKENNSLCPAAYDLAPKVTTPEHAEAVMYRYRKAFFAISSQGVPWRSLYIYKRCCCRGAFFGFRLCSRRYLCSSLLSDLVTGPLRLWLRSLTFCMVVLCSQS